MSDDEPKHIECYRVSQAGRSYCGQPLDMLWHFKDPMHAAYSRLNGDGIPVCKSCMEVVIAMLKAACI